MSNVPSIKNREALHYVDFVRDFIRDNLPSWGGENGLVVLDYDLILRVYGPEYDSDSIGRVALVELKLGGDLTGGQKKTFSMLDSMLTRGDIDGNRYIGSYSLHYQLAFSDDDSPPQMTFEHLSRLFVGPLSGVEIDGHSAIVEWIKALPIPSIMEAGW